MADRGAKIYGAGVSAARAAAMAALAAATTIGTISVTQSDASDRYVSNDEFVLAMVDVINTAAPLQSHSGFEIDAKQERHGLYCFEADDVARGASVFLMSTYEDGSAKHGTGTIISGSGDGQDGNGYDRILTAGHVTALETTKQYGNGQTQHYDLAGVYAFSSDGDYLATLTPIVVGSDRFVKGDPNHSDMANDVSVLEVTEFAEGAEADWNDRGVGISRDLSRNMLMGFSTTDGLIMNNGTSGAAVMDENDQVIGIVSYGVILPNAEPTFDHYTGMRKSLSQNFDSEEIPMPVATQLRMMGVSQSTLHTGGTSGISAISQKEILTALNVSPGEITLGKPPARARVSAYPSAECISEEMDIVEMEGVTAPKGLNLSDATFFAHAYAADQEPLRKPEQHESAFDM